jgi:hypothetical protein
MFSPEPVVDLQVVLAVRTAPILDPSRLDATEDGIELGVIDVEAHVIVLKAFSIGKVQGQGFVDVDGSEPTRPRFSPGDAQKVSQRFRRCNAIVARDNDVVESDSLHVIP